MQDIHCTLFLLHFFFFLPIAPFPPIAVSSLTFIETKTLLNWFALLLLLLLLLFSLLLLLLLFEFATLITANCLELRIDKR
jgi:hypothetical protein